MKGPATHSPSTATCPAPARRRGAWVPRAWVARAWLAAVAAAATTAAAAPKTVCSITVNSPDEKQVFQRHLPPGDYRFVELVERGRPDWLASACQARVSCDVLIVSGHFDGGDAFYTDRLDQSEHLAVAEMERASCSESCPGVFARLKEVYLFGCNTLKTTPMHDTGPDLVRALLRDGHGPAQAERLAAALAERHRESNRDRMRAIFKDVPLLVGFASKAPLGATAGPLLDRWFQQGAAREVASGRPNARLLELFAGVSMVTTPGLADADPQASFRRDACHFADDRLSDARKLAFLHELLQRDGAEVRLWLDHLERYAAALGPAQRGTPDVAIALARLAADTRTRDRFLVLARDVDRSDVATRMLALARTLGWLTPAQEQAEFVQLMAQRIAQRRAGGTEVDLACGFNSAGRDLTTPALLRAAGTSHETGPAAVLACLGHAPSHARAVQALTAPRDGDAALVQTYLRHRPLADVQELRSLTGSLTRLSADAQVRALNALAPLRLADGPALLSLARLFPQSRSIAVQRAIAGVLVRADLRGLARAELAALLRQHRLKSPDGRDVIDLAIGLLQGH